MVPAAFGYARVSQAEGENGLATQRRILNEHGLRDDSIFADLASGRHMRRPAWQRLREQLLAGDAVVVPRLDRLALNLSEGLRTVEELHTPGHPHPGPGRGAGHQRCEPHRPPDAPHAALPGRVGEGDHPGPDPGRRATCRCRGEERRKAPGAVSREAAGRPGLPGQRRDRQLRRQDLWCEPAHGSRRQERWIRRPGHGGQCPGRPQQAER